MRTPEREMSRICLVSNIKWVRRPCWLWSKYALRMGPKVAPAAISLCGLPSYPNLAL
jgi:hypothetical protein